MKTVFFVDDDGLLREVLARALERERLRVRTFESPGDLLAVIEGDPPDVIISDIQMPEMSGLELVEEIRKRGTDLPVILVSGHVTKDVQKRASELGVDHVLSKPIRDFAALARLITATAKKGTEPDDRLVGLDRLRMGFLTGLSHELRTPLTAIKLALDGLFSDHAGNGDDSRKLLKISQRNVDRLIRLVECQLDLLQITLHDVAVSRRLSTAQDIVNRASTVSRDGLPPLGVDGPHDGVHLFTDPERLQSVLEYIFRNVTDASRVRIETTQDGEDVVIRCTNTAITDVVRRRAVPGIESSEDGGASDALGLDFELRACQSLIDSLGGTLLVRRRSGKENVTVSLPRFPAFDRRTDLVLPLRSFQRLAGLSGKDTTVLKCRFNRNGYPHSDRHSEETAFLERCLSLLSEGDVVTRGGADGEYYLALMGRRDDAARQVAVWVKAAGKPHGEPVIETDLSCTTLEELTEHDLETAI